MATPDRAPRPLLWRLLAALPTLLVVLLVAWAALFLLVAPELPDTDALFADSEQRTVKLLAADGSTLAERGATGARFVRLDAVAPRLVQAVLATEDKRFWSHFGVDPIGLARAALANLRAGEVVAGGSTITQQLAKNLFLTPERSLKRKLQELALALWLEARLSKEEILTLYLNRVYLGAGAWGVEAAAQRYFGKPAKEVTLAEAAMLAGLLKAPSALAPTRELDRARERAAIVLGRMVEEGHIGAEEAAVARGRPARLAPETRTDLAGHFLDWVLDDLTEHLGKHGRDLVVRTTLDRRLQQAAEQALRQALAAEGAAAGVEEGAVVLLDASGAVRAMVGGESYRANRLNRAASARRQPGSAFKPFLYLAALRQGWTPERRLEDAPVAIGDWRPANLDGRYRGRVSLEDAFAFSLNTAAVRLIQSVGPREVVRTARELGIASPLPEVPSLALGTAELTLLELAGAYLPIATFGLRRPVFAVSEVRDDRGRVLYRHVGSERRVLDERVAATMQGLMAAVVERGTGRAARLPDRAVMGKTGTSQDNRDALFVGFAGDLLAAVWVGNDDGRPMKGVTGGGLPARIWREILRQAPATPPAAAPAVVARATAGPEGAAERPENGLALILDWVQRTFGDR
jgi:penicillin-binding protein 1A